ncbi:hypothetical protein GGS26DRAFT_144955 [Hypomontagnella submonticulosa]|nr:hypothetical protein GGS26DRAFT_144955 [Hypomontagnella submonticulosa]
MAPPALQTSGSALSSGSTNEKVTSPAEQKEIEAIWKDVYLKVVELAGGDPKKVEKTLDINAVLQYIENVGASDKKKAEKFGLFKKIVGRTLQCINTVGGIVASGASEVFAPAGMCYSALTFVIQAWQGYEGIFDNLAELLEKCTEFLERLESYQGRMDARLTRVAVQNLRLFVEICDRTIKMRRKHNKFLAFTKQLFLNDSGIQDLLGMMDRLNAKESLLVNAQTYKLVSDSAGDIKLILDSQREQKKEQEAKKWRAAIAKALGFPATALDSDGEPIPTWQRAFDARKNTLVDDTGKWIQENEVYLQWTKSTSPAKPVVVLAGKNGSGKTSMMANTLRQLRKTNRPGPTSRTVSAYFFMEGEKKKADGEETASVLELVSRTLLWQIATAYEAMTKSVFQILERSSEFYDSLDLWQQLFINNKERMNPETTFFLFIDGFDDSLLQLLNKLTSVADNKRARVFLTARPQLVEEWLEKADWVKFDTIQIADHNGDDITKYINFRMDSMPILKDTSRPGINEWRGKILETLRYKCAGDYFKLNTSLNALAKVDLIDDINEVLAEADKTRVDQIDAEIRRLNNNRTIKEIQEINEIIMWIERGRQWYPVDMLEDLLSVKHRSSAAMKTPVPNLPLTRRTTGSPNLESITQGASPATLTISLLPFAQKLAEKYPIFTVTDSGDVDWRSPEIKDRIPSKDLGNRDAFGAATSGGPQMIQESEIAIVRHFLNNVCPPDLFERFEFEQFFDKKLSTRHREYICLDPDNNDIKISITCLIILTEEELRKNGELRQYAIYWLLEHLKAVDLSAADRELKAQVGPLLVKLLTEECGVDSMFWPFDLDVSMKTWDLDEYLVTRSARCEWVYSTSGVQEISRWLHDSSVTKYIEDEPGISFVKAVKASSNLHREVLSHAAKHIAHHLFRRVEFLPRQFLCACWFLRGYLSRINPEKSSRLLSLPEAYWDENSSVNKEFEGRAFRLEEVKEIEDWAATVLQKTEDTPEQESSWEIHGALIIFQLCRSEPGANEIYQKRAHKAISLNPKNWHACHFIAKQPTTSNEEAVKLLSQAKKDLDDLRTNNPEWANNHANTALLARITLDLGDRLWDLGQDYQLAARTHRESLEQNYVHFKDYTKVITKYEEKDSWPEIIAFIETLNATSETWTAYFDELVNEFVGHLAITPETNVLAQAADATKHWEVIEEFFTIAIDIGNERGAHDLLFLLKHGLAKTLSHAADGSQEDKVIAIQETALQDIKLNHTDSLSQQPVDEMTNYLAGTYMRKAFEPNLPIEKIDSYGSLIANLLPDINEMLDIWESNEAICYLIRYHHKRKTSSNLAKEWVQRIVRTAVELLADEDEENDDCAYWLLARVLTTVEDVKNSRIAWTLRNMFQSDALTKWQNWGGQSPTGDPSAIGSLNAVVQGGAGGETKDGGADARPQTNEPAPDKPTWFVDCDGCHRQWTVMDEPLYTCADCVGAIQLCEQCYARMKRGELKRKGLRCKKDHAFFEVPRWDAGMFNGGSVPLPDSKDGEKRWMPLDQWRGELRKMYLDGDVSEVVVQAA